MTLESRVNKILYHPRLIEKLAEYNLIPADLLIEIRGKNFEDLPIVYRTGILAAEDVQKGAEFEDFSENSF